MPTLQEQLQELNQERVKLVTRFNSETDPALKETLRATLVDLDLLSDEIKLSIVAISAKKVSDLKKKIEALTGIALSGPFGGQIDRSHTKALGRSSEVSGERASEPPIEDDGTEHEGGQSSSQDLSVPPVSGSANAGMADVGDRALASAGEGLVLSEEHLAGLWKRSLYPFRPGKIIIFGIRGCLPVNRSGTGFGRSHEVSQSAVNYRTMNCAIGQWVPGEGFALFPGSTVPFFSAVQQGITRGGVGVNQMGRGRYLSYRPGFHKRSEGASGHWALLQECAITLQRTGDDVDFDTGDRWEVGRIAGDNIHCAFHMGPEGQIPNSRFSSVGCQVVAGTVRKGERGSERGPWAAFIEPFKAGAGMQEETEYVLFDYSEVQQVIRTRLQGKTVILRMGSSGPLVAEMQRRLAAKLGRAIEDDGDFGVTTFQAVLDFQSQVFGPNADDGIVGPETAAELGMTLPDFSFNGSMDDQVPEEDSDFGDGPQGRARASSPQGVATVSVAWGATAERKAGPGFRAKAIEIATRLRCDPSHLLSVIAFETGETFAPDIRNAAGSGATGLIQFMPDTAEGLGTTTDKLAVMSAVAQLDFVEKYLRSIARNRPMPTLSDLYMAVLLPAAVGQPEGHVLFKAGTKAYSQNRGLDVNQDGVITKAEAAAKVHERLLRGMKSENFG
ncbi:peptidoglycan-binding protein [Neorhizobium alkalisoli]|uniref:peptidoglycan-binding protein n=1 Tax=Neorhizobium alkalisoli TaxID=528178 RepID=UPI000CFA1224|nr:peptidoglycan-binding protein [Neorhizobium alkalisoli]